MERIGKSLYNVAPLAGAWIEILYPSVMHSKSGSLPSRERGLKCHDQSVQQFAAVSLPSRGRGLKSCIFVQMEREKNVAPLAGAWIEI